MLPEGRGSFFFLVTKDCFLWRCYYSLCSTQDSSAENVLGGRCFLLPPGAPRRGLYSEGQAPCPSQMSFPTGPPGLPFQLLPGLLISRAIRVKVQGVGFLCCPVNPLHLARPTSVPPQGEVSLMPKARCSLLPLGGTSRSPGRKQKSSVFTVGFHLPSALQVP